MLVRKKVLNNFCNTNKSITFAMSNWIISKMIRILELTEKEYDLIETVRNYKRSYPRGEPQLRWALRVMLEELIEEPLDE